MLVVQRFMRTLAVFFALVVACSLPGSGETPSDAGAPSSVGDAGDAGAPTARPDDAGGTLVTEWPPVRRGGGGPISGSGSGGGSVAPTYPAANYVTSGEINVEISFTTTMASLNYSGATYVWSISAGLYVLLTPSTGVVSLLANGTTYAFTYSASGWAAGAQVDFWFKGGGGVLPSVQYRNTYSPNTNGWIESGIAIRLDNFAVGTPAAIVPGTGLLYPGAYIDGSGSIGTVRGVNLHMAGGATQPSWAQSFPLTTGAATTSWIVIGDSLETGYNSGVQGWPSYVALYLGSGWTLTNNALAGQTTTSMLAGVGAQVYAGLSPTLANVVTFAGGINDALAGRTAAQIWSTFQQWSTCVRAYSVGSYSAWTTGTVYAPGALASVGATLYQTIAGGTSGATAPTGSTVDATVSDGGVTWFVTGPVAQNTGAPFAGVKLGVSTPPIVWGADTSLQPTLATLSTSILAGVGAGQPFDFLVLNLQASDVMNNDAQVPWRIADLIHPSRDAIVRQASIAVVPIAAQ